MSEDQFDSLDAATARRLRRLGSMPVDTSRLDRLLRQAIPPAKARPWPVFPARLRTLAASLLLGLLLVGVLTTVFAPASQAAQMARVHADLVSGKIPVTQVDSIQAANAALLAQWPQSPQVPQVPQEHVMACCMKSVENKQMACVLLKKDGVPVTMAVARAEDMKDPRGKAIERQGHTYYTQRVGALNMVLTERHGRWVCLMGEVTTDQLMDLAANLQF